MSYERTQTVPNVYRGSYTFGKKELTQRFNDCYNNNLSPWQQYYFQASIDRKVYAGDQHYMNRYASTNYETLKFVLNKTQKLWNAVGGHQRKHRKASRIVPIHNSSNRTASQKTKIIQGAFDLDDTYNKISDCFDEAGITGLSLMHLWMDYRKDPICGDLRSEMITSDMLMMDAFWKEKDLSDCQFIATRKYLKMGNVISLLPDMKDEILSLNTTNFNDTKFTFMPQQYNVRRKGVMAYDEFWYQDERMATFIVDPETYESYQYEGPDEKLEELRYQFPDTIVTKQSIPTVKLGIMVNGVCLYDGPNPLSIDIYPYVPLVAYHDTAINNYSYRYQGLIRTARDYQYLYNYRKQLETDLLAASFSGVDVEVDALVENRDAFKVGPGKVRFFKKGRLNAIRDVPGANMNPVNMQFSEQIGQEMEASSGVTPELLGASDETDVGITTMLKMSASLTTLQKLSDNLDVFQRNVTRLADQITERNYTYGKIQRMIGEEPTAEFRDRVFNKYDCAVENAPLTHTSRQMAFLQYYQLWKDGFPVPMDVLIDLLQVQDKDKWLESLEKQNQQQQQMQQQMAQAQLENQQIVNNSLMAKSKSDEAVAMEKISKIQLDKASSVEKITQAQHNLDKATLENLRAAKELKGLDIDHAYKLVEMVMMMTEEKKEDVQKEAQTSGV